MASRARWATTVAEVVQAMTGTLTHRGPDARGTWVDTSYGVALGHARLSIRDLSLTGAQPMCTEGARQVIAYNGEIYNAEDLREELRREGLSFVGTSDTEVVLKGCAFFGLDAFVPRMIGMFAFAFWDGVNARLTLVRDRLGVKPLYYGKVNGVWIFASELKALYKHPEWHGNVERSAIAQFLRYGYIHAPNSIFSGIHKLMPGTMMHIEADGTAQQHTYWDARKIMHLGQSLQSADSAEILVEETHSLLKDAVKRRMVADVPLGAFLSGGIDSSLVVALMQAQSEQKIRTFSVGFQEASYNEAPFAKAIATHLGTEHTEYYMQPQDAWDVIPRLSSMYDEPFGDSSQLPTYLLSAMTRGHVSVALSGDGGDEVFAGYGRYFIFQGRSLSAHPVWSALHALVRRTPYRALHILGKFAPPRYRQDFAGRLIRLIERHSVDPMDYYKNTSLTHWGNPESLVIDGKEPPDIFCDRVFLRSLASLVAQMQAVDSLSYLPDDILVKVDRASMATSLEVRVPLLDHRVFEHAWRLPADAKVRGDVGKWVLREILAQYVPRSLFERPKMGFGVPIDIWLRGPLRDWAEDLLDPRQMKQEGYLNTAPIQDAWARHLAGENIAYPLWNILMFQGFVRDLPFSLKPAGQSLPDTMGSKNA